jgi:hypothetical protein
MARETVGRTWYVKITTGMVGGRAELGTHHLDTGTQVWDVYDVEIPVDPMTEADVLDELYVVLLRFLERRTAVG